MGPKPQDPKTPDSLALLSPKAYRPQTPESPCLRGLQLESLFALSLGGLGLGTT